MSYITYDNTIRVVWRSGIKLNLKLMHNDKHLVRLCKGKGHPVTDHQEV
jgi:hypothetical protein